MSINKSKTFTVIHSRKHMRTCTCAPWIQMTQRILDDHDPGYEILITSAGMLHYDVPLVAWLNRNGRCRVMLSGTLDQVSKANRNHYGWLRESRSIELIEPCPDGTAKRRMQERDRKIVSGAEHIEVGLVNPRGRMRQVIKEFRKSTARVSYRRLTRHEKYSAATQPLPDHGKRLLLAHDRFDSFDQYIWHFTRGRCEPFPGESMKTYVDHLLGIGQSVPYPASISLKTIIDSGHIYAGSHMIRGKFPVVSFTGASWDAMKRLFHWQSHLRRVRFEPFAIGIRKTVAQTCGIHPVIYGDGSCFEHLPVFERWRFQAMGRHSNQWREECEWRCVGDFDLGQVAPSDLRILTPDGISQWPLALPCGSH